jgi:hypothetical protein
MKRALIENWPNWFRQIWPDAQKRWSVLQGYRAIGTQHQIVLTDIALRNNVFAPILANNPHDAAIAEGRRQCALDIFKLCNMDVAQLFARTEKQNGAK